MARTEAQSQRKVSGLQIGHSAQCVMHYFQQNDVKWKYFKYCRWSAREAKETMHASASEAMQHLKDTLKD